RALTAVVGVGHHKVLGVWIEDRDRRREFGGVQWNAARSGNQLRGSRRHDLPRKKSRKIGSERHGALPLIDERARIGADGCLHETQEGLALAETGLAGGVAGEEFDAVRRACSEVVAAVERALDLRFTG